jgi:hypothetical protein
MIEGVKEACSTLEAILCRIQVELPWTGVHSYWLPLLSLCPKMTELNRSSGPVVQ